MALTRHRRTLTPVSVPNEVKKEKKAELGSGQRLTVRINTGKFQLENTACPFLHVKQLPNYT